MAGRGAEKHTSAALGARAGAGAGAAVDFVFGFRGSTSAIPKRSARALRFCSSSSTGVADAGAVAFATSLAAGIAFGGSTFDCSLV
jgi:hypothetical protein